MTKYIVSGYIGFDNFGDEAIAKVLTEKLKSEGAEKITLISSNPFKTADLYGVESCGMLKFLKPLMESDVLISGGGSLLQDRTSIKSLLYYLGIIFCAIILRKRVIIYSQGIGPINSKVGQLLAKFILKRVSDISVRDKKSQVILNNWGISATLVKDPVFELNIQPENIKGVIGVQLRSFTTLTEDFLNKLADEVVLRFKDKSFKIISLQDSIDLDVCNNFSNLLNQRGINDVQIIKNLSVNQAFKTLAELEYLVGMRFHANVVGIKSKVKVIAINYDPKVQMLAEEYNLPLISLDGSNIKTEFKKLLNE